MQTKKKNSLLISTIALIAISLFTCAFLIGIRPESVALAEDGDIAGIYVATVKIGQTVTEYVDFAEAWSAASQASTPAVVKMYDDVTASTFTVRNDITLDLNGYVLKTTGYRVIMVINGGNFTLRDSRPYTQHKYSIAGDSGLWTIGSGDNTLLGGALTGGSFSFSSGAGVYVNGDGAKFTMESGTICGNRAQNGSGVCIFGDSPYGATFEMKGGKICGNVATASGTGGGVDVYYGTFEMTGGTICENTVSRSGLGGGVCVSGTGAKFTMKNGTICGNKADDGGGVFVASGGEFEISGAPIITGNKKIINENNVYLNSSITISRKPINVSGNLTEGAKIGVNNAGEVITGFTQGCNPADFFIPDYPENDCIYISDKNEGKVTIAQHTVVNDGRQEPTCTQTGLTEGSHCSACYTVFVEQETIPVDPTAHNYGDWSVNTPATCATAGEKIRTCTHNSEHKETASIAIDPTAHDFSEWTTVKAPTCEDNGTEQRMCSHNTDHTEMRSIPAAGHIYMPEFTVDIPATCTNEGSKSKHCLNCDGTAEMTVIHATGHDFGEWTTVKEATEDEEGEELRVCANDSTHTETRSVPKLITDEASDNSGSSDTPAPDNSGNVETPANSGLSSGAVVGIVLGALAFTALVVVVAVLVERKRRLR